ncbi:MAG: isoprenylcysteine carboxylmethyltransferase family protein [Rhodospirillaceae bacterium]|nr:isoprenylcysteine carboxylmethyltransferase family protein [Rhodospirillales bacterium]
MKIYPPIYMVGAGAVMAALDRWAPLARLIPEAWIGTGAVPAVIGLGLAVWSALTFRRHHTTVHPFRRADNLVTSGPFAFSRNPIYLGMALVLLGLALALGSVTPFLVIPAFMAVIGHRIIHDEERMLSDTFGAEFTAYARRVRRWL